MLRRRKLVKQHVRRYAAVPSSREPSIRSASCFVTSISAAVYFFTVASSAMGGTEGARNCGLVTAGGHASGGMVTGGVVVADEAANMQHPSQ